MAMTVVGRRSGVCLPIGHPYILEINSDVQRPTQRDKNASAALVGQDRCPRQQLIISQRKRRVSHLIGF